MERETKRRIVIYDLHEAADEVVRFVERRRCELQRDDDLPDNDWPSDEATRRTLH